MLPAELDFWFPFFVFGYGFIMMVVLSIPRLVELGEKTFSSEHWQRFLMHRRLGTICFFVGGLWALQNLLIH